MKLQIIFLITIAAISLSQSCSRVGPNAETDACKLVTNGDANEILMTAARYDKPATDEAKRLSSLPGICIYSGGDSTAPTQLVVGYRLYDTVAEIKAGFDESKTSAWKDQSQESLPDIGDDSILLNGKLIAVRKNKKWLQIGVTKGEPGSFSLDALKNAAKRAASSL